jgi:hypothetical protein
MILLEAIAHMEGFYVAASRPARNCNPGDLTYCAETISFGATKGDPRFAVFPDVTTGWNALRRWLSVPGKFGTTNPGDGRPAGPHGYLEGGYLDATLEQALWRFAPPNENNTANYVGFVTVQTGLTPTTPLTADLLVVPQGT